MNTIQVIKNKGRPEWAVIPYEDYLQLCALKEVAIDLQNFKLALDTGEEELLPEANCESFDRGRESYSCVA